MDELLNNYKNSLETSRVLWEEIHETEREEEKKLRTALWAIDDKISALESKKYEIKARAEKTTTAKIDVLKAKQAKEQKTIDRVKTIYAHMVLRNTNQMILHEPKVHTITRNYNGTNEDDKYTYNYFDPVKTIRSDEYCNIKIFIVPNGKPKNCYSLYVVGHCPFLKMHDVYGFHREYNNRYISGIHEKDNPEIRFVLKESPDKKDLLKYAEKQNNVIDTLLQIIDERAIDYIDAIALLNNVEWLKFYYEQRKDYYENHWSNGTKEPEYKEVCKRLEGLK